MKKSIVSLVAENVTFPLDFSDADKEKFGLEVQAEASRFLPEGDVEDLIDDVTGSKTAITVKLGKHVTKAGKGLKITYTFRLATWLAIANACRLNKVTGYTFPVDLTGAETFWKNWKRAEVTQDAAPQS